MRRIAIVVALLVGVLVGSPVSPTQMVTASGCSDSGEGCFVGARGPRGGIIFYDAGSQQWWGRFLEAETTATRVASPWGVAQSIYGSAASPAIQRQSMAIGMGRTNSGQMRVAGATLALTALAADQDWHIPSKDELDTLYNFWRFNQPAGINYGQVPVWTSSESEDTFAWYQLFHDGTQFTDANGIIGGLKSNKQYTKSAKHSGSDFAPADMHIIRVRAFPATGSQPPAPSWSVLRLTTHCVPMKHGDVESATWARVVESLSMTPAPIKHGVAIWRSPRSHARFRGLPILLDQQDRSFLQQSIA